MCGPFTVTKALRVLDSKHIELLKYYAQIVPGFHLISYSGIISILISYLFSNEAMI